MRLRKTDTGGILCCVSFHLSSNLSVHRKTILEKEEDGNREDIYFLPHPTTSTDSGNADSFLTLTLVLKALKGLLAAASVG